MAPARDWKCTQTLMKVSKWPNKDSPMRSSKLDLFLELIIFWWMLMITTV